MCRNDDEFFFCTVGGCCSAVGNHLWQSTVLAGVVGLLVLSLRRYQARIRYWLWLAASTKFLIPFSLLASLGSHVAWPRHSITPKTSMYAAFDKMSQPFAGLAGLNAPMSADLHPAASSPWIALLPILLAMVWLSGFVAVLLFWWVQWRRIAVVMRNAELLQVGAWLMSCAGWSR
jgi:bla regulator protein BlaR1